LIPLLLLKWSFTQDKACDSTIAAKLICRPGKVAEKVFAQIVVSAWFKMKKNSIQPSVR
jgi:hypothetical protein